MILCTRIDVLFQLVRDATFVAVGYASPQSRNSITGLRACRDAYLHPHWSPDRGDRPAPAAAYNLKFYALIHSSLNIHVLLWYFHG